jgi:hypothetical protein
MSTLLDLINMTCLEVGLPTTPLVVSSLDTQVKQLLALANREGREQVAAPVQWPQLQKVQTITLVNGTASYAFPVDFNAYIADTIWNPSMRWTVAGPVSPQNWEFLKSGLINTQPWMRYRIWAGSIYFDPTPSTTNAGQTVTIEYQSNSYSVSAAGVPQTKWTADTDTFVLPEDILVLGLKWRFLAAKRMDYSEEKRAWADACDKEIARAYGLRSQPLNNQTYADPFGKGSIQDGDFPGR